MKMTPQIMTKLIIKKKKLKVTVKVKVIATVIRMIKIHQILKIMKIQAKKKRNNQVKKKNQVKKMKNLVMKMKNQVTKMKNQVMKKIINQVMNPMKKMIQNFNNIKKMCKEKKNY